MVSRTLAFATILMCLVGASFAQSDIYTKAVPDQVDGKDYAGRPVGDVHFDFDRSEIRDEDRTILTRDAEWLKAHPDVFVKLEGDADERGDIVYNVVLSDRRAIATRDALVELGVPSDRILFTAGWGKLYPVCTQSEETCWSQNRRTHIAAQQPTAEPTQVAAR